MLLFSEFTRAQVIDKEKVMDYFQNQQFEDAITYLLPFYTKDSRNIQLLNYLGYASYMNEEKVNARLYFQDLLAIDSDNISANQYLANIYIENNNYDSAKIFILRLVKKYPATSGQANKATDRRIVYYGPAALFSHLL